LHKNKFQHPIFAPFNEDCHNENQIATKQQAQMMPTSIVTPPMVTPPIAPQDSPIVDVVGTSIEWSPTKLSGAKRSLKRTFSNESSSKL